MEYPGHGTRFSEPAVADLALLVAALAGGIAPFGDKPYYFFGHSMGAILAFELTLYLRRHGQAGPQKLFVSAWPGRNSGKSLPALPDRELLDPLLTLHGTPQEPLHNTTPL